MYQVKIYDAENPNEPIKAETCQDVATFIHGTDVGEEGKTGTWVCYLGTARAAQWMAAALLNAALEPDSIPLRRMVGDILKAWQDKDYMIKLVKAMYQDITKAETDEKTAEAE